jgi:hypothetical protein
VSGAATSKPGATIDDQARAEEGDEVPLDGKGMPMNSTPSPKPTEPGNVLIVSGDERLAREAEWISKLESEQDRSPVPVRPLAAGRPVLRGLIGLLLAASIFAAVFVSQSSQIEPAKLTVVRWVMAQLGSTSSEPLNQSERRVLVGVSAARLNAAQSMASQPTPSPQTAPQDVASTASHSLDQAQILQVIARDLAKLGQRIEENEVRASARDDRQWAAARAAIDTKIQQLNTRQEQSAGENAKPDLAQMLQVIARDLAKLGQRIEELNTRQEQMAGENAKAIEQLIASQDQLARDNAKTAEQIKATREQIARFLTGGLPSTTRGPR